MSTARYYYALQLAFTGVWWAFVTLATKKKPHELAYGPVFTAPRWLSSTLLLRFSRWRAYIFAALPISLALGVFASDHSLWKAKIIVAFAASFYHLTESAFTSRHGEYPLLYTSWAMLLPEPYAAGAAWGVAIHFILASGVAKLRVGGIEWAAPETMRTYLRLYHGSKSRPPLSRRLNAAISERDWASSAVAFGTLFLETGLVPGTLLMPPAYRPLASVALVGMHFGIGLVMSLEVGLVFLSTFPSYLVGFGCGAAPPFSPAWWCAFAIGVLPSLLSLLVRTPIPESWPWTAVALFMWNGKQANRIAQLFMVGNTRLVLYPHSLCSSHSLYATPRECLVGLPVAHHGLAGEKVVSRGAPLVVHDGVLRVLAFTLLHDIPLLVEALSAGGGTTTARVPAMLKAIHSWLKATPRLYERCEGQELDCCAFVKVDADGLRVVDVIASEP